MRECDGKICTREICCTTDVFVGGRGSSDIDSTAGNEDTGGEEFSVGSALSGVSSARRDGD